MTRALLLLAAAFSASGCISHKSGLDLPDPAGLQAGTTTRAEVYERFGLPDGIRRRADGVVLTYEIGAGRGYAVGVGWRAVGLSTTEERFTREALEIVLDPGDRVVAARWTDGEGKPRDLGP